MRSLIRRLRAALPLTAGTDERLLDEFVSRRADDAFAAIVSRHGPMVRGVCRRILRNDADADDAFQATFLVLVRKADAVRPRSRLGNFLYGVAVNVSRRCRDSRARRHTQELVVEVPGRAGEAVEQHDLRAVIDQELGALPDAYRAAVVACDLEGQSRSEAAGRLGWSEGTVASRLARGRALLADRLARRGVALTAAGLTVLAPSAADAVATVTVSQLVTGAPPAVELLATEVLKAMTTSKLKAALLAACAVAGLAGVGGATAWACGALPLRAVPTASAAKPFPLSSPDQPAPKPDAVEEGSARLAPNDAARVGTDKPGAADGGAAKPIQIVLGNPANDITVVSDRDERLIDFFRRQQVMVATVPPKVREKLLYDEKGPEGRVFLDYASFNVDGPRAAAYGASVKLAAVEFDSPAYRLLARARTGTAVVLVRDAADKELWRVAGFTTRPSAGFFAEAKRVPPDDFAPADLLHREPNDKK